MSSRHERTTPPTSSSGHSTAQAAAEAEAITTATIIAGLRSRLWHQSTLRHPRVRSELQELLEQVALLLGQVDPRPGRHRSPIGKAPSHQVGDAHAYDLKPDPLTATTPAEFITVLRQYKAWWGNPSWRKMAIQAGQVVVHSTMHAALNGDTLPKLEVVRAVIIGCGGGEDDLQAFATAWRLIESDDARPTIRS